MASSNDKIGINRLDHVCWAVQRVEDVLPLLTDLMGMTVEGRFENPEVGFRGVGLRVPGGTGHFELLEPYDEKSYLHRFLSDKGPGLHHVTFEVEDIEATAEAIRGFGIEPMGGVQRSHGWAETYIHPKDSGGVLFQFYVEEEPHEHPHVDDQVSHSHEYDSPSSGDVVDYYIMTDNELLTVREVARRCHRSEETIRRWIWAGKLPARKLGNQLFVEAADLGGVQRSMRVSEATVAYRPVARERERTGAEAGGFDRRIESKPRKEAPMLTFEGPRYTKEELLRQIDDDERFADEMFAKYGPVAVAEIMRELREEDD